MLRRRLERTWMGRLPVGCWLVATDSPRIGPIATPEVSPITDTIEPILPSC